MTTELQELPPEKLRRTCDPGLFDFYSTAELPELDEIIGQKRATRAINFGIEIESYGYNIYASGPPGAGKTTTIQTYLQRKARTQPSPDDWCYVNDFADPYRPHAIRMPAGMACQLQHDVDELLDTLREALPRSFESDEYDEHRRRLQRELEQQRTSLLEELESQVTAKGFALVRSPMGLMLVPTKDDQAMTPEQYQELSPETRAALDEVRPALQAQVEKTLGQVQDLEREAKDRLRNLDQEVAAFTVEHLFAPLKAKHGDHPGCVEITEFLDTVREDIVENIEMFKRALQASEEEKQPARPVRAGLISRYEDPFDRYRVNVMVDNRGLEGAPVVVEPNPTYHNLIGRIEQKAEFGALVTDFSMIKPGALHRANGGYLVVNARSILQQPFAWDSLKRALRTREIKIEEMREQVSMVATVGLAPEPVPLDVKVVLIGDPTTYYLLWATDAEFRKLFKVRAAFAVDMDWDEGSLQQYALFVHNRCHEENLKHFDNEAVAKVVEYGARLVEDQNKLTTRFAHIADLVREAHYWAAENGNDLVCAADVQQAIDEKIFRSNQAEERTKEYIEKGTIMVDTGGAVVGQVNGLSVVTVGDYAFGKPSRITARTYKGSGGVVNIEREANLSGNIHDKGVLILTGYMGGKYAQAEALSLAASICFEQSYSGIEGDSASSTELYALLSSLSGIPLKQGIAVTGSVNQRGEVQAIGGVNEKIEGFYDVCCIKGLTGEQGVLIPARNVQNLMLREDVVEAVREGKFHIWPVETIDQGITFLTGVEAGEPQEDGTYPEGTVNQIVAKRLAELAKKEEKKEKAEE